MMAVWNRQLPRSGPVFLAGVTFLLGLCIAAGGAWWWQNEIDLNAEAEFQRSVQHLSGEIVVRFRRPVDGLNGARGLFAASKSVERAEFRAYVESRDLVQDFPGVRGFGFIQRVMRRDVDAFVAAERADEAPEFTLRQLADKNHDDLYVIKFIEPAANNAGAQGLDIGSEANRRAAAQRAIDSGEPTVTAPIALVQDNRKSPGVLLYVPLYAKGTSPSNAAQRRASLVGLLYAPIVMSELLVAMPGVGPRRLDFELFDGLPGTSGDMLLYDTDNHVATLGTDRVATVASRYSIARTLSVSGRELTLRVRSTPEFDAAFDRSSKWLVFAAGALFSAMLALLLRQQATGRHRAEVLAQQMTETLREDEARSRDFSKSTSDWFWETDAEHRFCYFSDNFEAIYGLPPAQLIGLSRQELLDLDALNPPELIQAHLALLDAHQPFKNFEYQIRVKGGNLVWIAVSGRPHVDKAGCFAGYRGTGAIITARKHIEESLRASEARHRALFERSRMPMLLIDPKDGAIVDANESAATFYGYGREQLRNMSISEINQLSRDEIRAEMDLAASEKRDCFYFQHRLASGEIRQVEVRSGPLEIDELALLYSVITDITERRAAEMALAKETARLHALLETASDGIHILDENGNLTQFSHSFASMLGYADEEISGFNVADWDAQIPKEELLGVIQDLIKTPATFESRHRRKDGTVIDVEINAKGIVIAGENFLYASSRDIAERKHNEEIAAELGRDVAKLNQRLSLAADSAHIGVWDYSVPENRLVWDSWMYALYGIRDEDFSGAYEAWQNGLHPDDKVRGDEEIGQALRGEKKFDTEFRVKWPSGEVRHLKAAAVVLRDAEGKPLRMIGVNYDITERKRHEEEAANQRRRLNDIIEGTNVGTGEWNIQTGETVFNDRWAKMLGYTLEELAPTTIDTWSRLVHPNDLNRSRELILRHFAGELAYHQSEARMRHKNGYWVWVLLRGKVSSWTVDGKPLLMSGTQQDISASKQAEEEIRQAELLLRSAIETIGEAFVVYDAEDRLAFCNEKYREIYALSAPVIEPGRSFEEIIRYGVEHRQYKNAIGREEAWIAERLASHRQGYQDLVQQLDDGRWLRITERHTASGQIVGFRVDVTEYYRAKEAAEAANVAKSRFLATMSHEIRTPMNGILGMAQLLLTSTIKDDERQDYARIILKSGQTLLTLLNDILDISKVEAGKLELESIPFEPAQIIHENRVLFAEAARQKGLRIESEWAGASGQPGQHYLGDPHRLSQMLSNLVGNALKFTAKGHIRIEAREVERDGPHTLLEFSVTDTGIGIPEDKQALLFKAFSQADSSTTRQFGGTGLGLSLVRNLAKLMGGDVGLKSEAGQGARFWFRIRTELLAPGEDSRDEKRQAIVGADDTAPGVRPGTFTGHILVVDDNPTNRLVLKAMLNKPGVHCDFVEDGQQAVEAITGGMAPDLVLMDCQMPVLDGYEATMQIRRWETEHARPRLPIVALTASAFVDDRKRCLEAGMDDFLAKPIVIEKLMAMLGHWLASGSEMLEAAEAAPAPQAPQASITTQEEGPPVFDEKTLLTQLGDDRELARVIILSATEDIPGYFDQLEQAIAAGNWKAAERQTHTMKGLTAQIGGIKLSKRMKELDDHLKGGGNIDSATVIDLRREYQILSATLLAWVG
jgi:PAS domain S-box-containing protein